MLLCQKHHFVVSFNARTNQSKCLKPINITERDSQFGALYTAGRKSNLKSIVKLDSSNKTQSPSENLKNLHFKRNPFHNTKKPQTLKDPWL